MSGGSIEVHRPEKCRELDLFGQEFEGREDGLDLSSVRPASRVVVVGYAWPAGADPLTDKLCCCPYTEFSSTDWQSGYGATGQSGNWTAVENCQ